MSPLIQETISSIAETAFSFPEAISSIAETDLSVPETFSSMPETGLSAKRISNLIENLADLARETEIS